VRPNFSFLLPRVGVLFDPALLLKRKTCPHSKVGFSRFCSSPTDTPQSLPSPPPLLLFPSSLPPLRPSPPLPYIYSPYQALSPLFKGFPRGFCSHLFCENLCFSYIWSLCFFGPPRAFPSPFASFLPQWRPKKISVLFRFFSHTPTYGSPFFGQFPQVVFLLFLAFFWKSWSLLPCFFFSLLVLPSSEGPVSPSSPFQQPFLGPPPNFFLTE